MRRLSTPILHLASASPRRSALLRQIGITHEVRPVDVDESLLAQESPERYVQRLALTKAQRLWSRLEHSERQAVLGADTSVALEDQILGKPGDQAEGKRMLQSLSGRTHQVLTAVALCHSQGSAVRLSISDVTFRRLEPEEIDAYWRTGEPIDKAGGYAIQGAAALFVERIAGSYSGIVGLPLFETGELLKMIGWSLASRTADIMSTAAGAGE
jgi:septum formation protein